MSKQGIIITRVSTDEQDTHKIQFDKCSAQAKKDGVTIIGKPFKIDESASVADDRKKFQLVKDFIEEQKDLHVYMYNLDRWSRDPKDIELIFDFTRKYNTVFWFADLGFQTDKNINPIQKFMVRNHGAISAYQSDDTKFKVKPAMLAIVKQGYYPNRAPIGYMKNKEKSEKRRPWKKLDLERASLIKKGFEKYATGHETDESIYHFWKDAGLTPRPKKRGDGRLRENHVGKILTETFHYGFMKWDGKLWPHKYEKLITKELFDKVQAVRKLRNRGSWKGKFFMLHGLLWCGYCGCVMTHFTNNERGKSWTYYRCSKDGTGCSPQLIHREEWLDRFFTKKLNVLYMNDGVAELITESLKRAHEKEKSFTNTELRNLRAKATELENRKGIAYEDRLNGKVDADFIQAKFEEIEQEQASVREQIKKYEKQNTKYIEQGILLINILKNIKAEYEKADQEKKQAILRILIKRYSIKAKKKADGYVRYEGELEWRQPFDILYKMGIKICQTKRSRQGSCASEEETLIIGDLDSLKVLMPKPSHFQECPVWTRPLLLQRNLSSMFPNRLHGPGG